MNTKTRMMVVMAVALVVIVVGVLGWLWLVPNAPVVVETSTPTVPSLSPRFNTGVLQTTSYNRLDKTGVQSGAIPVLPPVPVGKPNPFL